MFCEKCGRQMPDDALFCEGCGARMNTGSSSAPPTNIGDGLRDTNIQVDHVQQNAAQGNFQQGVAPGGFAQPGNFPQQGNFAPQGGYPPQNGAPRKKSGGIIVLVIIGILLIAGAAATGYYFIQKNSGVTIDLNEFVTAEFDGYDTMGTATFSFDSDAFTAKYGDKITYKKSQKYDSTLMQILYSNPADYVESAFSSSFWDTKEGLSNGDTVEFVWQDIDEDMLIETTNIKALVHDNKTFTVEGLEPIQEIDPFENVVVTFSGENGHGYVDVENNNTVYPVNELSVYADTYNYLSNGEKIKVYFSYTWGDVESYCTENGVVLKSTEKTYTVEGLSGSDESENAETPEVPTPSVSADSEYILPGSDSRYIDRSELDALNAEQCRIARNEIYARHGRKFKDQQLQAHFDACSWYNGTIEPDNFSESIFNQYEKANKDLIAAYEKEKGYR